MTNDTMGNAEDSFTQDPLATNALFDCLANFIEVAGKEDKQLMIFLYHLSNHKTVSKLPNVIMDVEGLPEEVNDWLQYFPQT